MVTEIASLGGGCFWCLEAVYQDMAGVRRVVSGYMGGQTENPTYEEVCAGRSGHAEVVQVSFDNDIATYGEILDVFFTIHDPTTLDRQGNDVGTQYRSVIFFHTPGQEVEARRVITELSEARIWRDPIVTQVQPAEPFWPAEAYHQNYFREHTYQPYCVMVVAPKVKKFREKFAAKRKGKQEGS
jgi:peptide-methionine (S)-S-oxide reductase